MLVPLVVVGPKGSKRPQILRGVIENAANLSMECQQQPSKFSMSWFDSGNHYRGDQMSDVLEEIADNSLASYGALIRVTVSPMVVRDKGAVLVKARVRTS